MIHWYQPDEEPARDLLDVLQNIISDLQSTKADLVEKNDLIGQVTQSIESIEDAAYSVQDWSGTHLGETLDEARKIAGLPFYG